MKLYVAVFLFATIGYVLTSERFEDINDVVPTPRAVLPVKLKNGVCVDPGKELTPTQVKDSPEVTLPDPVSDHFYTLCMIDPDAPSPQNPQAREWLHWLVVNIPGNNLSKGEEVVQYVGAGPPKGTGFHRYIFLLFRQTSKIDFIDSRISNFTSKGRAKFSFHKFVEKYDMTEDPVAGNFFVAQWDEYVPKLYKQIG